MFWKRSSSSLFLVIIIQEELKKQVTKRTTFANKALKNTENTVVLTSFCFLLRQNLFEFRMTFEITKVTFSVCFQF